MTEKRAPVIGYMCKIDFDWELGNASDGDRVYPSVAALKKHHECWESCGIVEVMVTFRKEIEPGKD